RRHRVSLVEELHGQDRGQAPEDVEVVPLDDVPHRGGHHHAAEVLGDLVLTCHTCSPFVEFGLGRRCPAMRRRLLLVEGPMNGTQEIRNLERLHEVVMGSPAPCLTRRFARPVRGHRDECHRGVGGLDPGDELESIDPRQAVVSEKQVSRASVQRIQSILRAGHGHNLKSGNLQRPLQRTPKNFVVVDKQNTNAHRAPRKAREMPESPSTLSARLFEIPGKRHESEYWYSYRGSLGICAMSQGRSAHITASDQAGRSHSVRARGWRPQRLPTGTLSSLRGEEWAWRELGREARVKCGGKRGRTDG